VTIGRKFYPKGGILEGQADVCRKASGGRLRRPPCQFGKGQRCPPDAARGNRAGSGAQPTSNGCGTPRWARRISGERPNRPERGKTRAISLSGSRRTESAQPQEWAFAREASVPPAKFRIRNLMRTNFAAACAGLSFVVRARFWHWRVLILALAFVDKVALFRFGGSWAGSSGGETETEV